MSVLEQKMADETKDNETKDANTEAPRPSETLERLKAITERMQDAKQKVSENAEEFGKGLTLEQREQVLMEVLDRFDPNRSSPETKELFESMKRLDGLRGMLKTAEERMQRESEQASNLTPDEREARMREMLRRFEADLVPKLPNEKARTKAMVIIVVLDIAERQLLQGRPSAEEWARLKAIVSHRPDALKVVSDLESAIGRYDQDLQVAVAQGEADEAQMRRAHYGVIQQVLLTKFKALVASPSPEAVQAKPAESGESKA